jgi:acyl-coenzyme A thioesterase 9
MKDSYMEEYLPFKSSPELLDEYIFSDGKIRTGKLLEGKKFRVAVLSD